MDDNKPKSNILKVLLIIVLIIIVGLIVLEKTGNMDKILGKKPEASEVTEDKVTTNDEEYEGIINEYEEAMKDKEIANEIVEDKYKNVNSTIIHYYHANNSGIKLYYAYYDINNDNKDELLILDKSDVANSKYSIIGVFAYNGEKPVKLIDSNTLGDRSNLEIFSNGVMYLRGSGGASSGILEFYTIEADGYKAKVNTYYYQYDDSGKVSFYSDEENKTTHQWMKL